MLVCWAGKGSYKFGLSGDGARVLPANELRRHIEGTGMKYDELRQ
jgi:hypothetical protein